MPSTLVPEWTWADRVRKVRRTVGLNQTQFAARLGVSGPTVGLWEINASEPRDIVETARRIVREFGVSATWMLGLDDARGLLPHLDSNQKPTGYGTSARQDVFGLAA